MAIACALLSALLEPAAYGLTPPALSEKLTVWIKSGSFHATFTQKSPMTAVRGAGGQGDLWVKAAKSIQLAYDAT